MENDSATVEAPEAAAPAAAPAPAAAAPVAPAAAPAAPVEPADKPGDWNDKWRQLMAAGDEKALKQLERYGSPVDVWKKARALEARLSSGELKPTLGKNPTPEQLKEWRSAHGVPEEASKYDLGDLAKTVAEGVLAEILKDAHATNQTPDQVKATLSGFQRASRAMAEARAEDDVKYQQESEDELRGEWGNDFRRHVALIQQLLDSSGSADLKEALLDGRLKDGRPIGSHPGMLKMLLGLALQANPAGTLTPGGGADPVKGMREELEALQKVPTAKKTAEQSDRQRMLIDAAVKMKVMDANGSWITKS